MSKSIVNYTEGAIVALLRGGAWIEISLFQRTNPDIKSHSFAGVRGLKWTDGADQNDQTNVALLRGGAWIEIWSQAPGKHLQLLSHSFAGVRGLKCCDRHRYLVGIHCRTPSRGCVD